MLFHKKSWWSKHIITLHHRHVDLLVRVAAALVVVGLLLAFVINALQRSPISIMVDDPDVIHVAQGAEFSFHVVNSGRAVRDGITVEFLKPQEVALSVIDPRYDVSKGRLDIAFLDKESETVIPVIAMVSSTGEYSLHAIVRKNGEIISQLTTTLLVPKPVLNVSLKAQYFSPEGEQLGRGPMPPQVGETTRYMVLGYVPFDGDYWRDIRIIAPLGEHASWTGFIPHDSKDVVFDEVTRTVSWRVAEWPVGMVQDQYTDLSVAFELAINPTQADKGSAPQLLGSISVQATHKNTGEKYAATIDPILADRMLP